MEATGPSFTDPLFPESLRALLQKERTPYILRCGRRPSSWCVTL